MEDLLFFTQAFVAVFVILDAIGNVPIFISLLERFDESDKSAMIRKSCMIGFITLVIVTFTGNVIFNLLSIEVYSFRIAGGILLGIISIEMLFGRKSRTETSEDIQEKKDDILITPMAIPLLTGPGAMTTGVVLFNSAESTTQRILLLIVIILAFLVSYLILSQSKRIYRALGKTGTKVVIRVMGLVLLSMAVQFIINGITSVKII
jgi:multiple antibiotic resistance protein